MTTLLYTYRILPLNVVKGPLHAERGGQVQDMECLKCLGLEIHRPCDESNGICQIVQAASTCIETLLFCQYGSIVQ